MINPTTIYRLAVADFKERTRRYSFLLTLGFVFFFAYLVMTGKYAMIIGGLRGEYNSAFVGSLMALACTPVFGMVGFYLVKNSITRDRRTGVGEIIATTPLDKFTYVCSKFLSNLSVFTVMMLILIAAAVVMQLISDVENGFDLYALTAPFIYVVIPALFFTAAAAVFFESVKFLRGGVGNVIWLFTAEFLFLSFLILGIPLLDLAGIGLIETSLEKAVAEQYPGIKMTTEMGFIGLVNPGGFAALDTYHWDGINWTADIALLKSFWIGVAVLLTAMSALFLNRFDPAMERMATMGRSKKKRKKARKHSKKAATALVESEPRSSLSTLSASQLIPVNLRFSFVTMLTAELKLMLKGFHWIWYLIALALLALQLALPFYDIVRNYVYPAAWVWPIVVWSSMGTRESRFNTGQIMFSSAHPLSRQLPTTWLTGILIAVVTGAGMAIRAMIAADMTTLGAWLIAAIFIPTLALTLGTLSGTKKLFEVVYILIWYMGPINKLTALDFMGTTETATAAGIPLIYLGITLLMIPLTFYARKRQLVM